MKSNKIITILTVLVCSISIGMVSGIINLNSNELVIDYLPYDIGPSLRGAELPVRGSGFQGINVYDLHSSQEISCEVGMQLEWLVLDDYTGDIFPSLFELKVIGINAEIWLQVDLSYPDNRDTPIIIDEQLEYFLEEFETEIYPTCIQYFGEPDFHDGSNPDYVDDDRYFEPNGRNVILISNIRDEMYYDDKYPYYIVGYYWSYLERMHDRNIVTIDAHDWEHRVGDDDEDLPWWDPEDESNRPNLYEATLAHEYQHLIHDDYNLYDDIFMNEGCSMYAEPLCGYPIDWGSINSFLFTPDNSLTEWGDQGNINILADYGQALLWTTYLSDHYGGANLISHFVKTGIPGTLGIEKALEEFGHYITFDEIFRDWTIANLIHTNQIGDGKYNYISIDLNSEEAITARVYDVKSAKGSLKQGSDFGFTKTILNYNTHIELLGSYGSDYIMFSNLTLDSCDGNKHFELEFAFDGDNTANVPKWELVDQDGDGDLEWYSTSAKPESDLNIFRTYNVPIGENITLSFNTFYQIEPLWDYGFVQVSNDAGATWISLENEYTTIEHDPDAYPAIIDNLPGLTGTSDGWINMQFDLTPYAGQEIMLSFRYMTDWGTEDLGWYVDDIMVNDELLDNADNLVTFIVPEAPEIDFLVTLIDVVASEENVFYSLIGTMELEDLNETGLMGITDYISEDEYILIIVSPSKGPADYTFEIVRNKESRIF